METWFVAVFPGSLLYSVDCTKILQKFRQDHKDKYQLVLSDKENWKEQSFRLSFSKRFIEEAYIGFKQKGNGVYKRAKSIEAVFTQNYEGTFFSCGFLRIKVIIPDDWEETKKKMAEVEASFQLYHAAKSVFTALQHFEQLELTEFKKFFTYIGEDAFEGLTRRFSMALKEDFSLHVAHFQDLLKTFRVSLGSTRFFQLTVLGKSEAYKILMEYASVHVARVRTMIERDFISLFRRLRSVGDCVETLLSMTEEELVIYKRFLEVIDKVREAFSSQLEVSSTFFEVIGLTITLSTITLSFLPPAFSVPLTVLILAIFSVELYSLSRYSTGASIDRELDNLELESKLYQRKAQ